MSQSCRVGGGLGWCHTAGWTKQLVTSLGKTEQHNGLGLIWSSVEWTHREKFESFWETHKENLNSLIVQLSHKENCTF